MNLQEDIYQLLREIGPGRMTNTAYDTAWVARLGELDKPISDRALDWICRHQLLDGSWGARDIKYYHDRVISTLAAMIALAKRGRRAEDRHQIERGQMALEMLARGATRGLTSDPNGATIGFEMIVPTLLAEAQSLGIIQNQQGHILSRISRQREVKLALLKGHVINRFVTMSFSAEMAGVDGQGLLQIDNLRESNGSVAASPSATAYFAIYLRPQDLTAIGYLKAIMSDGGVPNVFPFDVFERTWALWNIALLGIPNEKLDQEILTLCQPHLDFLQADWCPGLGVTYAAGYPPKDSDGTSVTYEVLRRFGRSIEIEAVLGYEEETHFRCFALEAHPSISANVHILSALRQAGFKVQHPSIQKLLKFLLGNRNSEAFWFDKWHASPYYTTSHAVIACAGYVNELADNAIEWILKTQHPDGSWGYYISTAEETAYCLQALSIWRHYGGKLPDNVLRDGANWLVDHIENPYPPLWIGKCLYCPELVVRSAILSALMLVNEVDL
jgi:halimadienyl-diphosphate synthase